MRMVRSAHVHGPAMKANDSERENQLRKERKNYIKNPELLSYWSELLEELMKISKEYQWTLNEDCPSLRK